MAIESGYSKYSCDRCKKFAYLTTSNTQRRDYLEVMRVMVDGTQTKRVLCADCLRLYQDLVSVGDSQFTTFMANKPIETEATTEGNE